jgi:hypothetical protein
MASIPPPKRRQSRLNTGSPKPNVAVAMAQGLANIPAEPAMFEFDDDELDLKFEEELWQKPNRIQNRPILRHKAGLLVNRRGCK